MKRESQKTTNSEQFIDFKRTSSRDNGRGELLSSGEQGKRANPEKGKNKYIILRGRLTIKGVVGRVQVDIKAFILNDLRKTHVLERLARGGTRG